MPITDDVAAARAKYRLEREKRLDHARRDIPELEGRLAHYLDDPYTTAHVREPVVDRVDAIVVGGGFGGLLAAAQLKAAGIERVRVIDTAGDVGGVWYWNRYPGARCDVESYSYLPLLEDVGFMPTEKYSSAKEILEHAQRIARHFALYELALLQTSVTGATWNEGEKLWEISTDRNDRLQAQYLILANGSLTRLRLPSIPGIATFQGHSFHTSRWDYRYSGGDTSGGLTGLSDKRIGVVGTGATGLQIVPPVGKYAEHLYVFQRTPATVGVRANGPTDPEWAQSLTPGWQQERIDNFTAVTSGADMSVDLVDDGWTRLYRKIRSTEFSQFDPSDAATAIEQADLEQMQAIRDRVDSLVDDPATAELLKPYYRYLCKRPGFHDEYLQTFNRPNVTLVDTNGRGIESVYEHGVIANGRKYELDCLIFATGFESGTAYTRRIGFDVIGRDGSSLTQKWKAAMATLHGLTTAGFPNFFVLPGPNSQAGSSANFMHPIIEMTKHVAYIAAHVRDEGGTVFDVDPAAEGGWINTIKDKSKVDLAFLEACTPGRFNNHGRPADWAPENTNYGDGPLPFFRLLASWRAEGSMRGLIVT
jgi:cation diffusion facilitator CzcD-associated flavoprotein CzcO